MDGEPVVRRSGLVAAFSLARLIHDKGARWEIERVDRSTQWVAVLRESGSDGGYVRIVGGHDLGALRFKMDEVERDEAQERAQDGAA
jgi:hypothetical protein